MPFDPIVEERPALSFLSVEPRQGANAVKTRVSLGIPEMVNVTRAGLGELALLPAQHCGEVDIVASRRTILVERVPHFPSTDWQ